uniref:FCP1 homology domain-containing protein n=1 Tax=Tetraodon nigroviridis TaxID=99883 RepID=H3C7I1_TETNG
QRKVFRLVWLCCLLLTAAVERRQKLRYQRGFLFKQTSSVPGRLHLCAWSLRQGPQHPGQGSGQAGGSGQHAAHLPLPLLNTIPIKSWTGEPADRELQKLIPTLERLTAVEDIREVLKKRKDHFHRLLWED